MNAEQLLAELRTLRIAVEPRGSTLHLEAPPGVLTPELRNALAAQKAELLALLELDAWRTTFPCPRCEWPLPAARRPRCCLACGWVEGKGERS